MKALGYVSQGRRDGKICALKLFELGAKSLQNVDLIRSADVTDARAVRTAPAKPSTSAHWTRTVSSISTR